MSSQFKTNRPHSRLMSRVLERWHWALLLICLCFGSYFGLRASTDTARTVRPAPAASPAVDVQTQTKSIEEIRVGNRVLSGDSGLAQGDRTSGSPANTQARLTTKQQGSSRNDGQEDLAHVDSQFVCIPDQHSLPSADERTREATADPETWRVLSLQVTEETGEKLWIRLVRSVAWITEFGVERGRCFNLALPEIGVVGSACVVSVNSVPDSNPLEILPCDGTSNFDSIMTQLRAITYAGVDPSQPDATDWIQYPGDDVLPYGIAIEVCDGVVVGVVSRDPTQPRYELIGTAYAADDLDATDVTVPLWRAVDLQMEKPDGSTVELSVLRPLWWILDTKAAVGEAIDLHMHEIGVSGLAKVLRLGRCTVDSRHVSEAEQIVTGTIVHHNAEVWDVVFNGNHVHPLGVTANHPIYSWDRQDWIPVGELNLREAVNTIDGSAVVSAKTQRSGRHTVYNIEVHRAHSYYVSQLGILAHNTGVKCKFKVGKHSKMPTPRLGRESHHGVMSAWMKHHYPNYSKGKAPAVLMPIANHDATRTVFGKWFPQMCRKMGGDFDWGKVSKRQMRALSEKMFDAAKVPKKIRAEYWVEFNKMIRALNRG